MTELNAYCRADATASTTLPDQLHREQLVAEAVADGRQLASVREISAIDDIPGADLIKVAQVEGWKVVVKAGEFKAGDLCVFFEVDSFLPMSDSRFEFLRKNASTWQGIEGARLKTIRLRKQLSQGLALPLSMFPEVIEVVKEFSPLTASTIADLRQVNLTGIVGIMKWDKPVSAQLAGMAKGNFPSFLRKSDQERAQNMGHAIFGYDDQYVPFDAESIPQEAIELMEAKGELVYKPIGDIVSLFKVRPAQADRSEQYEVTIKMDGSSMTLYAYNGQVGVCSRNLDLKIEGNEENSFVQMGIKFFETLKTLGLNVAIQGELMGPGIQGNQEGFTHNRFFVYNVFDIDAGEFMLPEDRHAIINEFNNLAALARVEQLELVPQLAFRVTLQELGLTDMASLLAFAEGESMVAKSREGVVFKSMTTQKQFKVISNKWLENEK